MMVEAEVAKNKELQDRINMIRMLGLESSGDSSMLLGDCWENITRSD